MMWYARLSQWFGDAGLDAFDLRRSKPREGPLVLGTTEAWADGALEL